MLKKKLFGLFGKKESVKEDTVHAEIPETPVISHEQISSLENLSEEPESTESPEDIISKLAQINSIIGHEEVEEKNELEELFTEDPPAEEIAIEQKNDDNQEASSSVIDTLTVAASIVLECFPQEMLLDSVDALAAKNNQNSDFVFYFERTDLMYGLSIGKLEFTIGDLVNKLPMNVFRDQITTVYGSKVELPIAEILPLVPMTWFANRDQDHSREKMVEEMEDLFASAPPPEDIPEVQEEVTEEEHVQASDFQEPEVEYNEAGAEFPETPEITEESEQRHVPGYGYQVPETPDAPEESEQRHVPGYGHRVPEAARESDAVQEPPQEARRVAKLRKPAPRRDEGMLTKPVVPALDDVKFSPLKPSSREEGEAKEAATTDAGGLAGAGADADDEQTAVIHRDEMSPEPPPEQLSVAAPKDLVAPVHEEQPQVDADELREAAKEIFTTEDQEALNNAVKEPPSQANLGSLQSFEGGIEWKSQAPNGIDINRGGIEELMLLTGVGEHLARVIIDHRKTNGPFYQLQDLLKVPGLGSHTYRSMTRLSPRASIKTAEVRINEVFNIQSSNVSLSKIASTALDVLKLDAMFISGIDGLVLAKSAKNDKFNKLADSLSAVAPQLYKRSKKALQQGLLPATDMISFYFDKRSVTFSGSDQLFIAYVHTATYPNQKHLKQCRQITSELVWYCSYRAVLS